MFPKIIKNMDGTKTESLFKRHYPELDLLRAIAIALVMLLHYGVTGFQVPETGLMGQFIRWGTNGVNLFFALSGFLIGGQIIEQLYARDFSFKKFFFKRFLRIFPPYYFSILVVIVIFFLGLADSNAVRHGTPTDYFLRDIVNHFFYLQNYTYSVLQNDIYWTLAIEEQFYIAAPVLLFVLIRYAKRYLPAALAVLILIASGIRFVVYDADVDVRQFFSSPFHTRFDSLLFGVFAAYLFIVHHKRLVALSRVRKALILLVAIVSLGASFVFRANGDYFIVCWSFMFEGLGFSSLILFLTISHAGRFIIGKKFFALVAKLSYTMYLYHFLLVLPMVFIIKKFASGGLLIFCSTFVLYFFIVLGLSSVIFHFIDRPFMNYRKRVLLRWKDK